MRWQDLQEARVAAVKAQWTPMMKEGSYSYDTGVPTETHPGTFPVVRFLWSLNADGFTGFNWFVLIEPKPIIVEVENSIVSDGKRKRLVPIKRFLKGGDQPVREWNIRPHRYRTHNNWQAPNFSFKHKEWPLETITTRRFDKSAQPKVFYVMQKDFN